MLRVDDQNVDFYHKVGYNPPNHLSSSVLQLSSAINNHGDIKEGSAAPLGRGEIWGDSHTHC